MQSKGHKVMNNNKKNKKLTANLRNVLFLPAAAIVTLF